MIFLICWPSQWTKTWFCIWYPCYFDLSNEKKHILYMISLIFWPFQCTKSYFVYDILDMLTSWHHRVGELAVLWSRPWEITNIKDIIYKIMFFALKGSNYQGYHIQNMVFGIGMVKISRISYTKYVFFASERSKYQEYNLNSKQFGYPKVKISRISFKL